MSTTLKKSLLLFYLLFFAVLLSLGSSPVFAADVRAGLVSYWPLDVDSGGTTPDLGFGNTMTIAGGSAIVPGQVTNAFSFNGTSQYLGITHTTDNSITGLPIYSSTNGYTICFWVNAPPVGTSNVNGRYLFTEGNTANNNPLLLFQTRNSATAAQTNKLDVFIRSTAGTALINHLTSASVVFDNTWHHVAWVDVLGKAKLYVDGNLDATNFNYTYTAGGLSLNTTAIGALIRASVGGFAMNTLMDDVAIWQRGLSQDEVNQVRTNGISIPAQPVITQQPAGSTNAMGDRVTFTVSAAGLPPLSYQWLQNSTVLAGMTSMNLTLTSLTASGSNAYSVVITNAFGSVTSAVAPLVVLADGPPDPTVGLVSYWPMDVVNVGATTNTPDLYYNHTDLLLANLDQTALLTGQFSNALAFNVFGSSQYGKRVGGSPIYNTTNYTISLWVNGYPGQLNKQLFAEGGASDFFLLGTEASAPDGGLLNVKMSTGMPDRKSTRTVFDGSWHHVVWVDENGKGKLYVDGVLDETDFSYNRSNLVLNVTAVGALYRTTPANFFIGDVDDLAIWNRRLSYTEIQQVRTTSIPPPSILGPTITQQPVGSTNHLGERLTLSVAAAGTTPGYQWRRDGAALAGATSTSLALLFTASAVNDYTVVVSNIAGVITSTPAHVVVLADATPDLRAGLFYYWPLDTVTNSPSISTPDLYSADPFVLTGMDANNLVAGQFGNALSFDGFQAYGQRAGGFPIYLATNYTISFWVNGSPGQLNKQIFAEGGTSGNFFLLGTEASAPDGGLLNVKVSPGMNDRKSTRAVLDNTWHHIAWADANGHAKLYVDGVLDETDYTYTRPASIALQTTAIGALVRATPANYFAGVIDDVAVWDRQLSWTEVGQVEASSIPAPLAPVPPAIITQPIDQTNNVWATDFVSFSVLAGGTSPLGYQWWKNGVPLDPAANPTATNSTLAFASAQITDAGSYSIVVTNVGGAVTSSVVQLTVIPYTPTIAGPALQLDFDKNGSPGVQPGFTEMTLPMSGTNFGGVKVTLSPIGNITLLDRNRAEGGAMVVDNPPTLNESLVYNDFIFANSTTNGDGTRVRIERLAHSTPYGVTIWSFDPQSLVPRISDWAETSSGASIVITNGYSFDGSVLPTHDYDDTFGGLLTSSATGVLQIEGRKDGGVAGAPFSVFINAIRLVANPVIRITDVQLVGGNIQLTIETQFPNQPISLWEEADLASGTWAPASGGGITEVHGPVVTAVFTLGPGPLFYRVSSP